MQTTAFKPPWTPRRTSAPRLGPKPSIQSLSHKHEAIVNYLILNPNASLGEVAKTFEVSRAWLSIIIHSSAFRDKFNERQDTTFSELVLPLQEKLLGIGHMAVEKLGDAISGSDDPDYILASADKVLHRLGFAPKAQMAATPIGGGVVNNTQVNNYVVGRDQLSNLREIRQKALEERRESEQALIEGKSD